MVAYVSGVESYDIDSMLGIAAWQITVLESAKASGTDFAWPTEGSKFSALCELVLNNFMIILTALESHTEGTMSLRNQRSAQFTTLSTISVVRDMYALIHLCFRITASYAQDATQLLLSAYNSILKSNGVIALRIKFGITLLSVVYDESEFVPLLPDMLINILRYIEEHQSDNLYLDNDILDFISNTKNAKLTERLYPNPELALCLMSAARNKGDNYFISFLCSFLAHAYHPELGLQFLLTCINGFKAHYLKYCIKPDVVTALKQDYPALFALTESFEDLSSIKNIEAAGRKLATCAHPGLNKSFLELHLNLASAILSLGLNTDISLDDIAHIYQHNEDTLIDVFANDFIVGKINQRKRSLRVDRLDLSHCAPDKAASYITSMTKMIDFCEVRCSTVKTA